MLESRGPNLAGLGSFETFVAAQHMGQRSGWSAPTARPYRNFDFFFAIITYMLYILLMTWIAQIDEDAAKDIRKLPDSIKARFARTVSLIEASGPSDLPPSYVKHMGDGLYELRLKDKSGIARVFYVTVKPKRMIVLSAFVKKTQKTPKREIEKALTRRKAKQ